MENNKRPDSMERITTEALAAAGVTENVKQFPDPAFALQPQKTKLPFGFSEGNTIGINISPMILRYEEKDGITIMNYRKLIDHILEAVPRLVARLREMSPVWKKMKGVD